MTLGQTLRKKRTELCISLQALGTKIGVSQSYLCDVEYDRRTPSERVMRGLGLELAIEYETLEALAGKFSTTAYAVLREYPEFGKMVTIMARSFHTEKRRKDGPRFQKRAPRNSGRLIGGDK